MNVRDSEVISGVLQREGFKIVDSSDSSDIIILNTCSVRQHAEDKAWSEIGRFRKRQPRILGAVSLGKQAPRPIGRPHLALSDGKCATLADAPPSAGTVPIIGVVGCMAKNYKDEIFRRAPNVDFVVGPSDIHKIPEIIKSLTREKKGQLKRKETLGTVPIKRGQSPWDSPFFMRKIWETDGSIRPEEIYHTGFYEDKNHAYVVVSEGCSNFCSYCVVPYARGPLRNRDYKGILMEIEEAIDKSITSITLLGQNVNAYKSQVNFVGLLKLVNKVQGLQEFSFVTSHPKDTSLDLFKEMADCEKLKKYLHLPVQSGSDRILGLMKRGYNRKFYLDLADNYRKIVKGGSLTTDIIVGFPTETEADFQDTHDLVRGVEFSAAYIFKYSPRPHTEAAGLPDDVPREEKERRHSLILELQKKISNKRKVQSAKRKVPA